MRMSGSRGPCVPQRPWREISRRAALARSRLNATRSSLHVSDINVQFSGVDTMDSRQYRHTWVNVKIGLASRLIQSRTWTCRAMRDRISGGNMFTGCNMFRKDGINLRTSRALVSKLLIYIYSSLESAYRRSHACQTDRLRFTHL